MRRPACARSFWPLLVLCAGIGGGAAAQNRSLQGTFVNEQQSEKTVEAAIETAVSKMNFIKRPIARSRLKKTNDAHRRVEIALGQTEIGIAFDGRAPVEMPADGRTIRWKREDGETFDVNAVWDGDRLVLSVRDDGRGFAPAILDGLGKPYMSTKTRRGAGLGLFLAVNVLRTLGGTVSARNREGGEGGGGEVTLTLPIAAISIPEEGA